MNKRLIAYLRSIGLSADATEDQAWDFYREQRGLKCQIANALNYQEDDYAARTSCDVVIRALGFDPANPTVQLENEEDTTPNGDGASVMGDLERAALERGQQVERERVVAIRTLAGEDIPEELLNKALNEGWNEDQASREFLKAFREANRTTVSHDGAPAIHSRNSTSDIDETALSCALLHRANIDPTQGFYTYRNNAIRAFSGSKDELERAAEASYRFRDMSLFDIVRLGASLSGVRNAHLMGPNELFVTLRSGQFSTSALTNIFTTNMSSQLLAAFDAAPDSTTGGWIREADIPNFKTNERARLEKGASLTKLPRGSEADHAEYEDNVESYKIARYAQQFVVDEQDIIDDTFGGINQHTPSEMGEAARELRPDLVYSILIGNPNMRDGNPLFDASNHGNNTGSAAFALATLGAARSRMRLQTENGRNLNIAPRFLIVPDALLDTALEAIKSGVVIAGDANTLRGAFNAQSASGLTTASDARLDNGVTDPTDPTGSTVHAGSGTTWWLSGAASAHTIEVGYRTGTNRRPQMRGFALTQGKWGIGWDINLDIGAKALSWEGLQRQQSASL